MYRIVCSCGADSQNFRSLSPKTFGRSRGCRIRRNGNFLILLTEIIHLIRSGTCSFQEEICHGTCTVEEVKEEQPLRSEK